VAVAPTARALTPWVVESLECDDAVAVRRVVPPYKTVQPAVKARTPMAAGPWSEHRPFRRPFVSAVKCHLCLGRHNLLGAKTANMAVLIRESNLSPIRESNSEPISILRHERARWVFCVWAKTALDSNRHRQNVSMTGAD
jgi:hypothetical protein